MPASTASAHACEPDQDATSYATGVAAAAPSCPPDSVVTPTTLERLRTAGDILTVLRGPHQRGGRLAVVHVARERPEGPARIAVVASRRVGGAVSRNRAKRLLREVGRELAWKRGTDVVLVARAACASSAFAAVLEEVSRLGQELGALEELP